MFPKWTYVATCSFYPRTFNWFSFTWASPLVLHSSHLTCSRSRGPIAQHYHMTLSLLFPYSQYGNVTITFWRDEFKLCCPVLLQTNDSIKNVIIFKKPFQSKTRKLQPYKRYIFVNYTPQCSPLQSLTSRYRAKARETVIWKFFPSKKLHEVTRFLPARCHIQNWGIINILEHF